ncbi:MAG: TatD family hydrolase [Bacteroidales bacterium]|nr:TatD family hydrolase [Bacteroidales bacterium]
MHTTRYIDTHCHLYDEQFDADRSLVIARAKAAGCIGICLPNVDATTIDPMLSLCKAYQGFIFPMMGLHPTELPTDPWPLLDRMEEALAAPNAPYIAVGEVGIDLYWDTSRQDEQIAVLRHQANWAERYNLPLMIHTRNAHREVVDTLLPWADKVAGIFHCFGGTADEAHELLTRFPNFCLGIGGVSTFRKGEVAGILAAHVPLERLVLETDAPYLAPVPYRGQRNEPAHLPLVLHALATAYDTTPQHIATQTTATAQRLFRLPALPSA